MARKRNERTSRRVGSAASRVLRGKGRKKDAKSAAGSALTQRPDKKKTKRQKR